MAQQKTNPQKLLPAHIPFYRTRLFWQILLVVVYAPVLIIFMAVITPETIKTIFSTAIFAAGGGVLEASIRFFIGGEKYIGIISAISYVPILVFLLWKTSTIKTPKPIYPLILIGLMLGSLYYIIQIAIFLST